MSYTTPGNSQLAKKNHPHIKIARMIVCLNCTSDAVALYSISVQFSDENIYQLFIRQCHIPRLGNAHLVHAQKGQRYL